MELPKKNPSFSSSLLDAIYRSIDEDDGGSDNHRRPRTGARNPVIAENFDFASSNRRCFASVTTGTKKLVTTTTTTNNNNNDTNAVPGRVVLGRRQHGGTSQSDRRQHNYRRELQLQKQQRERHVINSSSSSSESSYGGFSSSEAESVRMMPTRTAGRPPKASETKNPRQESATSLKSRFRASKIYDELKKAKGPVSPGGRLASFINHLFNSSGGLTKMKTPSPAVTAIRVDESTFSSVSSYSKSCLSKAASSSRPGGSAKRSVGFYPACVFVSDDQRPCGNKPIYEDSDHVYNRFDLASLPPLPPVRVKSTAPVKEKKGEIAMAFGDEENDDDDDAASYSSSDLFELENLTAVGADELPVYETTHLGTNRAIARGLIV